jgi:hypothetical protein
MKTLSLALLLMASLAFVLTGCSDNSAVPVSPTDQSTQTPALLEKSNKVDFTFSEKNIPPAVPAKMWVAGGVLQIRDAHAFEAVDAGLTSPVTGTMEHYLDLSLNVVTGEGPCHGSFILRPTNLAIVGDDAIWVGTYEGYRSKTSVSSVFTLPLKLVAHGRGGNIDGMQAKMTVTLNVLVLPPDSPPTPPYPPYPAPYYWWGTNGAGTIIQH